MSEHDAYLEDLTEHELAEEKARIQRELRAIGLLEYPCAAAWGSGEHKEDVVVLGPVHWFPPYNDPVYGKPTLSANASLLCERKGERAILMAYSLYVQGKRLLKLLPPRRIPVDRGLLTGVSLAEYAKGTK